MNSSNLRQIFRRIVSKRFLQVRSYPRNFSRTSSTIQVLSVKCRKSESNFPQRYFHTGSRLQSSLVSFILSDIGEGIKEVELRDWFVSEGDNVHQFDDICEVQSDKASVTITSRYDGIVKKLHHNVGDIVQVGDSLVDIESESDEVKQHEEEVEVESEVVEESQTTQEEKPLTKNEKSLATPAVRHFAKQNNISLTDVKGSGKDGRILKEDIISFMDGASPAVQPPVAKVTRSTEDQVEPIKGIRKAMFQSMTSSLGIPHFGYDDEYNLTTLVSLRKKLKKEVKQDAGIKLSYMPFIIKAASLALNKHPIVNSQIDGANIVYKANHNISLAIDTPHGLLLPNIKNVQDQSIFEISVELNRLHEAGLNNKLTPNDLAGGTFSLSNIGNIGGTYARPVIFPPQVAIGALGRIQVLPRFDHDDNLVKAHVMCVSWSGDHRVIEGATMARFSNHMKEYLEEPEKMLLHLK